MFVSGWLEKPEQRPGYQGSKCEEESVSRWPRWAELTEIFNYNNVSETLMTGDQGLWVSPDNDKLAYLQFSHSTTAPPTVSVVSLSTGLSWSVSAPVLTRGHVHHVASVSWATPDTLCITWLDEKQTEIFYSMCPSDQQIYQCSIVRTIFILTTVNYFSCILGWDKW